MFRPAARHRRVRPPGTPAQRSAHLLAAPQAPASRWPAVTGTSPKGSVHIYNLDDVKFRNERTGTSAFSVDETFTDKVEYSTEKPVSQITVQGILYSKENATITLQIKKDGESVFNQSKQLEAVPGIDTTVDLVYSTLK